MKNYTKLVLLFASCALIFGLAAGGMMAVWASVEHKGIEVLLGLISAALVVASACSVIASLSLAVDGINTNDQ